MLEFRYDTQLLIEGTDLDEDAITDSFAEFMELLYIPDLKQA